jgi:sodium/proline symporter
MATALSAVSTCHSGFMFIGMIGFTYRVGVSAIWLIIAWLIGDLFAWQVVYPRLRKKSESMGVSTIVGFVSHAYTHPWVRPVLAVFVLTFLSVYAAAQLTAGSKALWIMLGWPQLWGCIMGAVIVAAYSFSGGIRASVWTDVAQSIVMFFSMIGLATVALIEIGGVGALWGQLQHIDPHLIRLIPMDLAYGFGWYALGWMAFGVGVIAQPHIVTRPMAIKNVKQVRIASYYYMVWYAVFSLGAICVGLTARVLLPELISADPELALPFFGGQSFAESFCRRDFSRYFFGHDFDG